MLRRRSVPRRVVECWTGHPYIPDIVPRLANAYGDKRSGPPTQASRTSRPAIDGAAEGPRPPGPGPEPGRGPRSRRPRPQRARRDEIEGLPRRLMSKGKQSKAIRGDVGLPRLSLFMADIVIFFFYFYPHSCLYFLFLKNFVRVFLHPPTAAYLPPFLATYQLLPKLPFPLKFSTHHP